MQLLVVPQGFKRIFFGAFLLFWLLVTYMVPNKIIMFPMIKVPLTPVDNLISLAPWTIWIYVSTYFGVALTFLSAKNEDANDMFYTLTFAAALSFFFFFFLPTYIDRADYIIQYVGDPDWSVRMLQHIRATDNSNNCLPSMHVVMGWAIVIGSRGQKRWVQALAIVYAIAVIYSTMSTKQHYFLDAVGGSMLALFTYVWARKAQKKPVSESPSYTQLAS